MRAERRKKIRHTVLRMSVVTACLLLFGIFMFPYVFYGDAYAAHDSGSNARWDMSSFMVLGDSIAFGCMAGYKDSDGEIIPEVDPRLVLRSWPKLVADQAGVAMDLPFYAEYPDNLSVPRYTLQDVNTLYSSLVTSSSVVKSEVTRLVMEGYYNNDLYGDMSPFGYLLEENPRTVAVMIGNNNVLGAAVNANVALKTPIPSFEMLCREMISDLAADTDRAIVVSTIPDVSAIPFINGSVINF